MSNSNISWMLKSCEIRDLMNCMVAGRVQDWGLWGFGCAIVWLHQSSVFLPDGTVAAQTGKLHVQCWFSSLPAWTLHKADISNHWQHNWLCSRAACQTGLSQAAVVCLTLTCRQTDRQWRCWSSLSSCGVLMTLSVLHNHVGLFVFSHFCFISCCYLHFIHLFSPPTHPRVNHHLLSSRDGKRLLEINRSFCCAQGEPLSSWEVLQLRPLVAQFVADLHVEVYCSQRWRDVVLGSEGFLLSPMSLVGSHGPVAVSVSTWWWRYNAHHSGTCSWLINDSEGGDILPSFY